ncbi:hypothetical protein GTP38_23310 [Duganella sp. FT94W]|uniref:HK97 gp10 family phage protein n=1 Tax=Duganella lactea TaxID=2692173 RepID=A0ABW9VCA7_9BURK|nr:hypothetical protein [Duganella lactea]
MSNDTIIVGGRQLNELLKTLAPKVERNILRSALRAGAKVYLQSADEKIPVDQGDLRESLRISTKAKRGVVSAGVKVGNKKAWYASLVEYGTKPHKIKAKNARALSVGGVAVAAVDHPGAKASPFMRPAADESHQAATDAVAQQIRRRLTKEGLSLPDSTT